MFISNANQLKIIILLSEEEENFIVEYLLERMPSNGIDTILNNIFTANSNMSCFKILSYEIHQHRPANIHQNIIREDLTLNQFGMIPMNILIMV